MILIAQSTRARKEMMMMMMPLITHLPKPLPLAQPPGGPNEVGKKKPPAKNLTVAATVHTEQQAHAMSQDTNALTPAKNLTSANTVTTEQQQQT